jgi:putative endonuclease
VGFVHLFSVKEKVKIYKFFVYIMATDNNRVIYIGVTRDLKVRVEQHRDPANHGFTGRYNIHKLVYLETFGFIEDAIHREKQLKEWRRAWKDDLINKSNPQWHDLTSSL